MAIERRNILFISVLCIMLPNYAAQLFLFLGASWPTAGTLCKNESRQTRRTVGFPFYLLHIRLPKMSSHINMTIGFEADSFLFQ